MHGASRRAVPVHVRADAADIPVPHQAGQCERRFTLTAVHLPGAHAGLAE